MTERTATLCTSCSEITPRGTACTSCGNPPEATMLPCGGCGGTGRVQIMRGARSSDYHPDARIQGEENCRECGGFGEIEPEFVVEAEEWAAGYAEQLARPMSGFEGVKRDNELTVWGRGALAAWIVMGGAA